MHVLYEDNHLMVVYKEVGEIVQGDKSGDEPISEKAKRWLKEKYQKPGNVFVGVVHRLDRPVAGLLILAKTSKALSRLNKQFHDGEVTKTYRAIVQQRPAKDADTLSNYLKKNEKQNKSYAYKVEVPGSKLARLHYQLIASSDRYHLLEVNLDTGRHHQIRCQLAAMGCPIRGDLKYGYPRSNPDAGISLIAYRLSFKHPVADKVIDIVAPTPPNDTLWQVLCNAADKGEK